ncbi:MAG: hypothetical protein COW30_00440 [Rhodospirillales bacterium CG15_BIG_FIL_POST_REV_8_21_14_020_66_15]|nr:MAG: hypothetical protein COW30_00440 [Rhodospirillales bacterium CG15_BIG_FIL_POST_REV_8_21_14_020_66_15]
MLQFHVTAKLAKALKVRPEEPPVPDGNDWLEGWYVRDIPLDLPLDALLFTNAETFYSLIHPFDRREPIDEIVGVFQHRLEHITGRDFTSNPGAFRVCKTASRRVLGCMNELTMMIEYEVERHLQGDGVRFEVIEQRLNAGVIGGTFPENEFRQRLEAAGKRLFKPTKTPHLRLVH